MRYNFVPADEEETCHECGETILLGNSLLRYTIREPFPLDEEQIKGVYKLKALASSHLSPGQPKVKSEELWSSTVRFRFRSTRVVVCEACGKLLIESEEHPIDKEAPQWKQSRNYRYR